MYLHSVNLAYQVKAYTPCTCIDHIPLPNPMDTTSSQLASYTDHVKFAVSTCIQLIDLYVTRGNLIVHIDHMIYTAGYTMLIGNGYVHQ